MKPPLTVLWTTGTGPHAKDQYNLLPKQITSVSWLHLAIDKENTPNF